MGTLLNVENLEYYYGAIQAVKGINLHVDEGEFVTIIGSNSAGKSTTLKTISGLTKKAGVHGKITFDGKDITRLSGNKITAMGLGHVLEGRHIFANLTVDENIRIGAYLRNDTAKINEDVQQMYKLFPRLLERKENLGGNLSGGEQQMLAIARALMGKPKMLLFDEPSLGLAPIIVHGIFEAMQDLNKNEGLAILVVEQNSKIALGNADRGYVLQTGEVVLEDTCENLLKNEDVKKAYLGG